MRFMVMASLVSLRSCCHYHSRSYAAAIDEVTADMKLAGGNGLAIGEVLRAPGSADGALPQVRPLLTITYHAFERKLDACRRIACDMAVAVSSLRGVM
jgi:hypothetical protein